MSATQSMTQAAFNSSSSFYSKGEWKKAMKQAWATVHNTKEQRREASKKEWNEQEAKRTKIVKAASARTKAHMDKISQEVNAMSEEDRERANAEAIYADYEKKWNSRIAKRLQ
jgi:hypothetical protein